MGRARARERAAAEQRPAQVRRAAARAGHDPLRRPLERRETVADHARLAQHLQRAVVAGDMELVARLPPEGVALIGADLGRDAQLAQETESAPRRSGAREVEVERDLAAPTEVQAARGMRETRELREPVALLAAARSPRARSGDPQTETPSSSSSRRLYPTPSEPYEPSPSAATTRWHGTTSPNRFCAQTVPTARCAFRCPASAATSP